MELKNKEQEFLNFMRGILNEWEQGSIPTNELKTIINKEIDKMQFEEKYNGVPRIICKNCGEETIKSIHFHICKYCKKDYRKES